MANSWFLRTNNSTPSDPLSYNRVLNTPNNCTGGNKICAVYATIQYIGGEPRPYLSLELYMEMVQALDSQTNTTNVLLKPAS